MTQNQAILNHLQTHQGITSMDAFELFGVTRLSARIFNLREQGHNIINVSHTTKTRFGGTCTYTEYRLVGGSDD